jgi:hypothetical protein
MKNLIKKILKEEQLDLFGGEKEKNNHEYKLCSHYDNSPQNKKLCIRLNNLGQFLYKDLGLRNIIDEKLKLLGVTADLNQKYQKPLQILYNTGRFNQIKYENGVYTLDRLKNTSLVYDQVGEWDFMNKLNTNYSDLAELLTELFIRGGITEKLYNKSEMELKTYLLSIKDKLGGVLNKYFKIDEYKDFVRNTKENTKKGEKAEDDVRDILQKFGMKLLYQGGNGDHIDMIFGADLIMNYKGKTYLIQVKNKENQMIQSSKDSKYRNVDYFASPTKLGIAIKGKGENITNIDFDGKVINEPKEKNT